MRRAQSALTSLKVFPGTLALISISTIAFLACALTAGTLEGNRWTMTLLRFGAQFNPLSLDREGYRLFTAVFLHGGLVHLIVNIYLLTYLGYTLEPRVGTRKFLFVFFVAGLAGSMSGLYWNLFTVGVGASGALCGLMGFSLVRHVYYAGKSATPMVALLLHFSGFAALNLFLPDAMYADYAANFGGVIAGIAFGFVTFSSRPKSAFPRARFEFVFMVGLLAIYFFLPRSQVQYFRLFKQVVAAEDSTRNRFKENLTDDQYMRGYILNYHQWDEVLTKLRSQPELPVQLATDTFKLRQYVTLRKQENLYKKWVVQQEAYVYLDSVEHLQVRMKPFMELDYSLWSRIKLNSAADFSGAMDTIRVMYDSNGVETSLSPAAYYRVGHRDSAGRWTGPVREYYGDGSIRMKGTFRKNKRDGIFLYYSRDKRCVQAGRYYEGKKFGKWETFYPNGRRASETFYHSAPFVNSVWDSTGTQLVVDGNGREVHRYPDGVVALEGEYRHGRKEGVWYGRYPGGELHFEETYNNGILVSGRSRSPSGETFVYDETSLSPMPEGGFQQFYAYLKSSTARVDEEMGHVNLSFRVTKNGVATEVTVDQSASPFLDAKACEILQQGPRWLPARMHGHEPVEGEAFVQVAFY